MAILESGIIFDGITVVSREYYASGTSLDKNLRAGLLSAISGFAKEAFKDNIESFSLSNYEIVCLVKPVRVPGESTDSTILTFAIIEKGTNSKTVKKNLKKIVGAFLSRYSLLDVRKGNVTFFEEFGERMDGIFKDLRLKSEDRFKSVF
ncbi:MAG: hypothetical protein ACTSU5_22340 [Promethearchaeota archaeon]